MPYPQIATLKQGFVIAVLLGLAPILVATPKPSGDSTDANSSSTTYIVVRHAEKATEAGADGVFDAKDPPLSAIGQTHAAALASALRDTPLYAVYATPFKRTQNTAQPSAADHRLKVNSYAPNLPIHEFVAQLHASAKPGVVLVIGHSNTVPEIVAALCHCPAPSLSDADYGDRFDVRVDADGRASLTHLRY
jgi:broad specificity phosphatase PhoE